MSRALSPVVCQHEDLALIGRKCHQAPERCQCRLVVWIPPGGPRLVRQPADQGALPLHAASPVRKELAGCQVQPQEPVVSGGDDADASPGDQVGLNDEICGILGGDAAPEGCRRRGARSSARRAP